MIKYHGTPFSGDGTTRLALLGRHAMISFAEPRDIEVCAEVCQSFALDNGAYTTWKSGKRYDPAEFFKWAELWLKHPGCDWALAPDVIEGGEAENDALLAEVDERYVPVWHLHESLDRLERLAGSWPRIAFGSSGQYSDVSTPRWWGRMAEALDVVTDEDGVPLCKLHGLRMLDSVVFAHVPFASADSTNVGRNIGLDDRWTGPYVPASQKMRAMVMIDRIESHASARNWNRETAGAGWNRDLLG
jgi:hypothetical protein